MLQNRTLIFILMTLTLIGCGYHLRGGVKLPKELKIVYLDGGSAQLRHQFREQLDTVSGKLSPTPEAAAIAVKIKHEDIRRRILSLSSRGRSNEVELDYRLEYELIKSGKILPAAEPIQIRREYFNDQEDVIAKDNEEKVILNEIYQQAIQTIMNHASAELRAGAH